MNEALTKNFEKTFKPWIIYLRDHIRLLVNVLIVGSGAREHSLGWKLSESKHVDDVFYAPGFYSSRS